MEYARIFSMRNNLSMQYPSPGVIRYPVPFEQVHWQIPVKHYRASSFTAGHVFASPFADLEFTNPDAKFKWNQWDGTKNRKSYEGKYGLTEEGIPQNPMGRTGICGRGVLLNWGVNHHVTCLITRRKTHQSHGEGCQPAALVDYRREYLAVQRLEDNEWEIPTGAVQPGEGILDAQKRVIFEDLFCSKSLPKTKAKRLDENFSKFISSMVQRSVYTGYVDDNRNTDNAWVETTVFNIDLTTVEQCKVFDKVLVGPKYASVDWLELPDKYQLSSVRLHSGQNLYLYSYLYSLVGRDVEDEAEAKEDGNVTAMVEDGNVTAIVEDGIVTAMVEDGNVAAMVEDGNVAAIVEDGNVTAAMVEDGNVAAMVEDGNATAMVEDGIVTAMVEDE